MMMKKELLLFVLLFITGLLTAQHIPLGINYQAIARDNAGNELKNRNISVRFSIISGSSEGNITYSETHSTTTDPFGLFNLTIGQGSYYSGIVSDFTDIDWGASSHFLRVEVNFGDGFIGMGTMPFLAVPYALYAANAGQTGTQDLDKDPENELQVLSSDGNSLSISNGNTIPLNDIIDDADADPLNEMQDLKLEDQKLRLTLNSDPTIIDMQPYLENTDEQQLTVNKTNNSLSISGGNTVTVDVDSTNEIQELNLLGYNLSLSKNGGTVSLQPDIIAFRALKDTTAAIAGGVESELVFRNQLLDTGEGPGNIVGYYNEDNGIFTVPSLGGGLYQFNVNYEYSQYHSIRIYVNDDIVETIFDGYGLGVSGIKSYSFILMLDDGDKVRLALYNQSGSFSGKGTFYGYRIH